MAMCSWKTSAKKCLKLQLDIGTTSWYKFKCHGFWWFVSTGSSMSTKNLIPGLSTSVTTPARTLQYLYLHLKPVPKVFVLVSMLFSLQMQTWKLVPNFVLQTSNTPQNDQEESLYWFLTESHTGVVLKTPKKGRGTVLPIALVLYYLLNWWFPNKSSLFSTSWVY